MIYILKIILHTIFLLPYIITFVGCATSQKSNFKSNVNFCQRNYSEDSFVVPFMEGVFADNGRTVYDKFTGFFCETSISESNKNCNSNMTLQQSRDGNYFCKSKLHQLNDLCENNEYLKYFDAEDVHCKN